jgi:hypothetical protein
MPQAQSRVEQTDRSGLLSPSVGRKSNPGMNGVCSLRPGVGVAKMNKGRLDLGATLVDAID